MDKLYNYQGTELQIFPANAQFTDTTYEFDGIYDETTNKGATVSTVTNAIDTLDSVLVGSAGVGKTLATFSQTNGVVSATFGDISITKSQISDFPTLGTAAAKGVTDNTSSTAVTSSDTNLITGRTLYYHLANAGYLTSSSTLDATRLSGTIPSGCYTNTTYSSGTSALLSTGTDTEDRVWTAKILHDNLAPLASPTFTGTPKVGSGTDYTTSRIRNLYFSTSEPSSSDGSNGDICIVYTT